MPVIVVATERTEAVRLRALAAGASEILVKPLEGASVVDAVRRHAQRGEVA